MIYTKVVGVTDHPIQIHEFLANTRISQSGISDGFLVTQADILGLKVKVALGRAFLIKDDNLIAYPVLSDASEEVIITANGSGNPRIDTIVLYYEEGAVGGSQGTEVAKLLVVDGNPATIPSPPSDSDIISAMGGDYPYIPLADVSVSSGAAQILNANITDRRTDFILDTPTDIHGLTAKTTPVDADELIISDSASSWLNKKITWANLKSNLLTYFQGVSSSLLRNYDGWQDANETWTYVSSSTFTVSGNVTNKYYKGVKIKWTQTTGKYGYVVGASYSAGTGLTTITIAVNTDHIITNAVISANYFSIVENPAGFPQHFNFNPINTGLSLGNGTMKAFYTIQGRNVKGRIDIVFGTTSSFSGTFNFNIPAEAIALIGIVPLSQMGVATFYDAGGTVWTGVVRFIDSTHIGAGFYDMSGSPANIPTSGVTNSTPFSWTTSDELHLDFEYESL